MIFDPPTKSRRRIGRLLWLVLIAGVVAIAAVVTSAGEETQVQLEYLDEIRTQASELSRSGAALRDLMARVREVDREEFVTVFESVSADLDVALAFVIGPPSTDSLIPVRALYRQTVQAWSDGVELLFSAMLRAADDPEDAAAVNDIADGLGEIRTGDLLFQDLKAELQRPDVPQPVSPLTDVRLSPGDGGLVSLSATYAAAAQASTNNLGLRPGLQLSQVLTTPEWQPNVEGQTVVPATDTLVFSVVVTNSGNVESQPETVELVLSGPEEEEVRALVEVPPLRPGAQTTLQFVPIEVAEDTAYEVAVELILSNPDSDLTDNVLTVPFIVNPA